MFDRFTERARKVMTLARQEAFRLKNDYIGTEHILLGLASERSGVASHALKNLGVDLRKVRAEVERIVEQGTMPVSGTMLPFTPRAKRVLELALEEAQELGHNYIGTEHLLLGLIREQDGPAAHILQNLDVEAEAVREEVVEILGAGPGEAADRRPSGWEGVPASPGVDWAKVARLRDEARRTLAKRVLWARTDAYLELVPLESGWEFRLNVVLYPPGERSDCLFVTLPGGRLEAIESDLPRLVESVLARIEGKTSPDA